MQPGIAGGLGGGEELQAEHGLAAAGEAEHERRGAALDPALEHGVELADAGRKPRRVRRGHRTRGGHDRLGARIDMDAGVADLELVPPEQVAGAAQLADLDLADGARQTRPHAQLHQPVDDRVGGARLVGGAARQEEGRALAHGADRLELEHQLLDRQVVGRGQAHAGHAVDHQQRRAVLAQDGAKSSVQRCPAMRAWVSARSVT